MTSRRWTPSWTRTPTSRRVARSSRAGRRWRTRWRSRSGARPGGWWRAAAWWGSTAALGLLDQVTVSDQGEVDLAFWYACHGGQLHVAEQLVERGATVDWVPPWEPLTPLDAAERHGFTAVATWLRGLGAHSYQDL